MGNLWEQMAAAADLTGEPVPGLPLVELAGDRRVLIEGHLGVTGYSDREICIRVKGGSMAIGGEQLTLSCMNRERLIITGKILCVRLFYRGKGG